MGEDKTKVVARDPDNVNLPPKISMLEEILRSITIVFATSYILDFLIEHYLGDWRGKIRRNQIALSYPIIRQPKPKEIDHHDFILNLLFSLVIGVTAPQPPTTHPSPAAGNKPFGPPPLPSAPRRADLVRHPSAWRYRRSMIF